MVHVTSDVVAPVPPTTPSSLSSGIAQPSVAEAGLLPLDLPVGCGARGKDPLLAPTSQASGGTEPQVGSSSPLISVELQAGTNLVFAGEVAGVAVDTAAPDVPCVPQEPPVPSVKLPTWPKAKGGNKAVKVTVDEVGKKNNIRRSSRSKAKADDHTLEKTTRMAAKRNLESPGNSFTTYSDSQITSNLGRVGINLGSSDVVVKASAIAIKNLEVDKMVVAAKNKKK